MDILFRTKKLQKDCTVEAKRVRRWGAEQAVRIGRRLDNLRAADNLETIRLLGTGRCHELIGDRKGQLSLDLVHPMRLIFVPAHEPPPTLENGGLDWSQVTAVEILGVEDTHG